MNWMQIYEVIACAVLVWACIQFNRHMRGLPRAARVGTLMLGVCAMLRGASLFAKFNDISNLSRETISAADASIKVIIAVILGSIAWQQIRNRVRVDDDERSADAR